MSRRYLAGQVLTFLDDGDVTGLKSYLSEQAEELGLIVTERTDIADAVETALTECLTARADSAEIVTACLGVLGYVVEDTEPSENPISSSEPSDGN